MHRTHKYNFLFLKCLAFSNLAFHYSLLMRPWYHLPSVLRMVSGLFFEHGVQFVLSWCLSSSCFPLCPPHIQLMDHSSEWLQIKLLIITLYCWINCVQRFLSGWPQSLAVQEKRLWSFWLWHLTVESWWIMQLLWGSKQARCKWWSINQ